MSIMRKAGHFFGPWLAFAVLSALGSAFLCGATVTIIGMLGGIATIVGDAQTTVGFLGSASTVVGLFPTFALFVLLSAVYGLVGGFLTGLVTPLVGGRAGMWWSFTSSLGALWLAISFGPLAYLGDILPITFCGIGLLLGSMGASLPVRILQSETDFSSWDGPFRHWLRASWLVAPTDKIRLAGLLLPIIGCALFDITLSGPEFGKHSSYIARLGIWATWKNSHNLIRRKSHWGNRSSCSSNLHQIMLGLKQYTQDYDGKFPRAPTGKADGVSTLIQPYIKLTWLFQCPAEFYRYSGAEFSNGDFTDYWFNAQLYGLSDDKLKNPSGSVVWGDGNTGQGEADAAYSLSALPPAFPPASRHDGGAHYAFHDGHVAWFVPGSISNTRGKKGLGYSLAP
jgi:prepilin-type processing-associated H-X9-DG protein